ncbi:MAG TPA: class I SAM-dependent methyltransferase [Edaphobacter sp.]
MQIAHGDLNRSIDALERLVEQFAENDALLLDPSQLRRRVEALDLLDAHFPDASQPISDAASNTAELYRRARAIYARLEAVNCELYEGIRGEIRRGGRPDIFLRWVASSAEMEGVAGPANGLGYDYLDELISGVFRFEEPDAGPVRREAEMVLYQPTPARHIFHLIGLTALTATDVLVDIGCGLGHVPLLASILTSARSIGIELEATYVERARQSAESLNLKRVTFIQHDARAADLSAGTVFYLYTPFTGSILSSVLNRLRREAAARPIRICTYGPCTSVIAEESWLEAAAAPAPHRIALFRSRS